MQFGLLAHLLKSLEATAIWASARRANTHPGAKSASTWKPTAQPLWPLKIHSRQR